VTKHVWSAYEEAVERFQFHYPYSRADQTPWGTGGFLGLAESPDERRRFDVFLREEGGAQKMSLLLGQEDQDLESTDFTHVLFTRYLEQHLKAWRLETYGPSGPATGQDPARTDPAARALSLEQPLPGTSSSQQDDGFTLEDTLAQDLNELGSSWTMASDDGGAKSEEAPEAVGPDGVAYRLIHQTARRLGATVKQLRHIEKAGGYTPLRAKDVPGLIPPRPPQTRLYPATPEADQQIEIAVLRSRTHAGRLVGKELTRTQAAAALGVPTSTLCYWERQNLLVRRCPR
jgi:hypothetical protein